MDSTTAPSAREGFKVFEAHQDEIGLLMTDQRMPGDQGVWLLEKARELRPHVVRVLATAYADLDAVIEAVNTGAIYKYVQQTVGSTRSWKSRSNGDWNTSWVRQERDALMKEKKWPSSIGWWWPTGW